jgi:hypothetical protein
VHAAAYGEVTVVYDKNRGTHKYTAWGSAHILLPNPTDIVCIVKARL